MRSFAIASALLAATVSVSAQAAAGAANGTAGATAGVAGNGTGTDHVIMVGMDGLAFTPNEIKAAIGDTVTFQFMPGANGTNHTVTQSSFAAPCTLLTNTTTNQVGFDSGYVPVPKGSTQMPSWTLQVQVATPLWAYCKQGKHCQAGMVLGINVDNSGAKSMAAFTSAAKASGNSTTGAGGNGTTGTGAAGAAASGSTSGASSLLASSGVAFTIAAIAAALA